MTFLCINLNSFRREHSYLNETVNAKPLMIGSMKFQGLLGCHDLQTHLEGQVDLISRFYGEEIAAYGLMRWEQ